MSLGGIEMHKFIGGAVILGMVLVVLWGFTAQIYQDDIRVFPKKESQIIGQATRFEQSEAISVINQSQEAIRDVVWLDGDAVRFVSSDGRAQTYHKLSKELRTVEIVESESTDIPLDTGGQLTYTEDDQLALKRGDKVHLISPQLKKGMETNWVLAPDHKKVIYADQETGKLTVYLFSKTKNYVSSEAIHPFAQKNLREAIGFSPDGGYLFLVSALNDPKGATFSVYGADSAKAYGVDIMGYAPLWAPGKLLKIAYHFSDQNEAASQTNQPELSYVPDKIGLFDIRTKKASFLTLPEKGVFFGPMAWRVEELFSTFCNEEGQAIGTYRYGVKTKKGYLKAFNTPIPIGGFKGIHVFEKDNKLAFYYQTEVENFMVLYQGIEETLYSQLKQIVVDGSPSGGYFSPYGLVYYTGQKLYLKQVDGIKVLLELENAELYLYPSPLGDSILLSIRQDLAYQTLMIQLDEL